MSEILPISEQQAALVSSALHALDEGDERALSTLLAALEPVEVGRLLESLPDAVRSQVWKLLPEEETGEVLTHLGEIARNSLVEQLDQQDVVQAASALDTDDLADVIETLPEEIGEAIRESLDNEGLKELEDALAYAEGSAGRLMSAEAVSVRADITLETVLRYLRRRESLPSHTNALMVVDRESRFLGELPLSSLLTRPPETTVSEVMDSDAWWIDPSASEQEVASVFRDHDLVSLAVVNDNHRLIGRITIDDVVDVIDEAADRHIMGSVGLDEDEDLFSPVWPSAKRRALWLGINLGTAVLAAWVIGLFEATLQKVVALAVLMPIVASMGGIAGSQTLTLVIRGLALGNISSANARWLAYKEIAISVINGIAWAVAVALVSYFWFENARVSLVLAAAMVTNLLAAALSGVTIPLGMRRLGIDPALAGSVVLTTVTDVVGFLSFLGLATLFLV